MLVLRAVVDQQEEPGSRQAFHQGVQKRLGLGIDPVQVLADEEYWLDLTFAHEDPSERVQGALAALGRLERLPLWVLHRHLEECQERRRGEC
jgi:hypothetical protein